MFLFSSKMFQKFLESPLYRKMSCEFFKSCFTGSNLKGANSGIGGVIHFCFLLYKKKKNIPSSFYYFPKFTGVELVLVFVPSSK